MSPLSREALVAAVQAGRTFTFLPFYGHTPRADGALSDACFSQWFVAPFEANGVRYVTAEQFMMAEKARLFGDEEALAQILHESDPAKAKALGRRVRGYDDARWEARRFDAVTEGSIAKFSSTPALRAYLLATGDAVLVEAAPRDQIWGIGLGRANPLVSQPAQWRGRNLLGFALMRARAALSA
ncbi:MAG: NADAR family protein [Myxococcota bacterium]